MIDLFKFLDYEGNFFASESFLLNRIKILHDELIPVYLSNQVDEFDHSWRLPDKPFPYSCTDEEGLILAKIIKRNSLRSGFEIATAFGYSSIYIASALQENNGKLISLDCYVEEWKESYLYDFEELRIALEQIKNKINSGVEPSGLAFAKEQAKKINLSETIQFEIAISPQDISSILDGKKIDFAFIDGGHFGDQPSKDFAAIYPYLSSKCAVFFHDNNNNESVERATLEAASKLNTTAVKFSSRYNLTLVGRQLDDSFTQELVYTVAKRRSRVHKEIALRTPFLQWCSSTFPQTYELLRQRIKS